MVIHAWASAAIYVDHLMVASFRWFYYSIDSCWDGVVPAKKVASSLDGDGALLE
jgi:hypothetical protein